MKTSPLQAEPTEHDAEIKRLKGKIKIIELQQKQEVIKTNAEIAKAKAMVNAAYINLALTTISFATTLAITVPKLIGVVKQIRQSA